MSEFFTRRQSNANVSALPYMTQSAAVSSQWPFVLRCHPDYWELAPDGGWRLEVSKIDVMPGVGGASGKYGEKVLETLNVNGMVDHWRKIGDGQWRLLEPGATGRADPVLAKVYPDPDPEKVGAIVRRFQVRTEAGRTPFVFCARWERLNQSGGLENDDAELKRVGDVIARELFGLEGPTEIAKIRVIGKLKSTLMQVESSSRGAPSPERQKRIANLRRKLAFATGDDSWLNLPQPAPEVPVADDELQQLIKRLGGKKGLKALLKEMSNE